MIQIAWTFWSRNKFRFISLLAGILIISTSLSFLFSLTESKKGTVLEAVEHSWSVSYDILVRPTGSSLTDNHNGLFEPNFHNGITGGITMEQFQHIKDMTDVEIAAPIAVIGYTRLGVDMNQLATFDEYGVYRSTVMATANNGIQDVTMNKETNYFVYEPGELSASMVYPLFYINSNKVSQVAYDYALLVGIDPESEAQLVGLNQAILPLPNDDSRYFLPQDKAINVDLDNRFYGSNRSVTIPILLSANLFADKKYDFTYERLNLPFETKDEAIDIMNKINENGNEKFLDQVHSVTKQSFSFESQDVRKQAFGNMSGLHVQTGGLFINPLSTPLSFESVEGPYGSKWPFAYRVNQLEASGQDWRETFPSFFRKLDIVNGTPVLSPQYIGVFDPSKLEISKYKDTAMPIETYSDSKAISVLDNRYNPVNPPKQINSVNNPLDFMTSPPTMLTTIDAAQMINDSSPISVIRIKVGGVSETTSQDMEKVKRVALDITDQTGLTADVTFGSAPQPVLINVPESGRQSSLGWVEQRWIKLGSAFSIGSEVRLGYSGLYLLVIFVALLFIFSSSSINFLIRKQQYAVLLTIGWRYSRITQLILIENALLGLIASIMTWSVSGLFLLTNYKDFTLLEYGFLGVASFLICMMGTAGPLMAVRNIQPSHVLKTGEVVSKVRSLFVINNLFQFSFVQFRRKMSRNIITVLSMTIPTVLLIFSVYVSIRLNGIFYSSWLGEYTKGLIGSTHYLIIGICLSISIFSTAENTWNNIRESTTIHSILRATGWKNKSIVLIILWEIVIAGLISGFFSFASSFLIILLLYKQFQLADIWIIASLSVLPVLIGFLGAIFPALQAVRSSATTSKQRNKMKERLARRIRNIVLTTLAVSVIIPIFLSVYQLFDQEAINRKSIVYVPTHSYPSDGQEKGRRNQYLLDLQMKDEGLFSAKAKINIVNQSEFDWDELVFYMVPNVFTNENNKQLYRDSAMFEVERVLINGQVSNYTLTEDTLMMDLEAKLLNNETVEVLFEYQFTVPEQGIRFSREGDNYYLAQWYPMLATFTDQWEKQPFVDFSESYHTDFNDFSLHYDLHAGYTIISSATDPEQDGSTSGTLHMNKSKELMLTISNQLTSKSIRVNNTEIRVWADPRLVSEIDEAVEMAAGAFEYYEENIGPYVYEQLDVVLNANGPSMEYPGIVTVTYNSDNKMLEHSIAHEIAHQWFYAVVSNNPYFDGWLDEGLAELSTSIYLNDFSFAKRNVQSYSKRSNLPLSKYKREDVASSLYAVPVLKLSELFSRPDNKFAAATFLRDYYDYFKFKQVDTDQFVSFTRTYFDMEDDSFFHEWLEVSELVKSEE